MCKHSLKMLQTFKEGKGEHLILGRRARDVTNTASLHSHSNPFFFFSPWSLVNKLSTTKSQGKTKRQQGQEQTNKKQKPPSNLLRADFRFESRSDPVSLKLFPTPRHFFLRIHNFNYFVCRPAFDMSFPIHLHFFLRQSLFDKPVAQQFR